MVKGDEYGERGRGENTSLTEDDGLIYSEFTRWACCSGWSWLNGKRDSLIIDGIDGVVEPRVAHVSASSP